MTAVLEPEVAVTEPRTPTARGTRRPRKSSAKKTANVWSRNLHSWSSMICMLLILFFAVTGLTLNHPEWLGAPVTVTHSGVLPTDTISGTRVDYLGISEYLRSAEGITGTAGAHSVSGTTGVIDWSAPAAQAAVTFDTETGAYTVTKTSYGIMAFFNDLHRGSNTSGAWGWVIDGAAILLSLVALSGLVLQMVMQKRRKTALILLGLGSLGALAMVFLA